MDWSEELKKGVVEGNVRQVAYSFQIPAELSSQGFEACDRAGVSLRQVFLIGLRSFVEWAQTQPEQAGLLMLKKAGGSASEVAARRREQEAVGLRRPRGRPRLQKLPKVETVVTGAL